MRPEEIDYSDKRKHYFDISNGEVLAGEEQREHYLAAGAAPEDVRNLGAVLREPLPAFPWATEERLNTADWTPEKYLAFGKWIYAIVAEPTRPQESHLNGRIITNANQAGLGPSVRALRNNFTTITNFYSEIDAKDTHKEHLFDDWEIENFIAFVKQVGGKKRPTIADFAAHAEKHPDKPQPHYNYIYERFRDIGGVSKLLELAGYMAVRSWDDEDYIDWGVKFMQANGGIVPSKAMANYLSKKQLGPSEMGIRGHFPSVHDFQMGVLERWRQVEGGRLADRQEKLAAINEGLAAAELPPELFDADSDKVADNTLLESDPDEAVRRYAEYSVLGLILPGMDNSARVDLCLRTEKFAGKVGFTTAAKSAVLDGGITAGEVERGALMAGVFDDIWPMDSHMQTLKLDEGYEEYYKKTHGVKVIQNPPQPAKLLLESA